MFDNILKRFECLKLTSFRRRLQMSKERMEAMQMTKRLIRVHGPGSQLRRKYISPQFHAHQEAKMAARRTQRSTLTMLREKRRL